MSFLKTLFLHPPSFEGFDGGAGSRYQARREIRSFWYPTWLAQPAALVPGSRLIDAPPDGPHLGDQLVAAFAKYAVAPRSYFADPANWSSPDGGIWAVTPDIVFGWTDFPADATRWRFVDLDGASPRS